MTRENGEGLYGSTDPGFKKRDLKKREEIINGSLADLCISIHLNVYTSPSRRGAQTFFTKGYKESENLAKIIQSRINGMSMSPRLYNALWGDYYLLNVSKIPTVIVECGFLSNPDDEVSAAILALMEQHKLVTEGAGAVSVAAAMFGKLPLEGKKTVCILSGGNIDVTILSRVITRGLVMSGRSCHLNIELVDKPGQLLNVSKIIAEHGGNVTAVHHEHASAGSDVNGCYLRLSLETRNHEHIEKIKKALTDFGIKIVN